MAVLGVNYTNNSNDELEYESVYMFYDKNNKTRQVTFKGGDSVSDWKELNEFYAYLKSVSDQKTVYSVSVKNFIDEGGTLE